MKRVACAALLAVGCGREVAPPAATNVALGGGVVARVDDLAIGASLVGAVAAERNVSPAEAASLLLDDALAARGARARSLHASPGVRRALSAAHARLLEAQVRAVTIAAGPPADQEIREASEARWREVDLPEQVHVVHAVVLRKKGASGPDDEGRARAQQLAATLVGATSPEDFLLKAHAFPRAGRDVRAEDLPPFVKDGRIAAPGGDGAMDATFAGAAFALAPGQTSAVVESGFGFHVIRMVELLPGRHVPPNERPALFASAIYAQRARTMIESILSAARGRTRVEVDPAAAAAMQTAIAPVARDP